MVPGEHYNFYLQLFFLLEFSISSALFHLRLPYLMIPWFLACKATFHLLFIFAVTRTCFVFKYDCEISILSITAHSL